MTNERATSDSANELIADLASVGAKDRASNSARYFKTGPGEYGEGDKFLGVSVANTRKLTARAASLADAELRKLALSEWHEARLLAALGLVRRYERASDDSVRETVVTLWIELLHKNCWNNWDLIDTSAHKVVGPWLLARDRTLLFEWIRSENLWERRAALIASFEFLRHGDASSSLQLAAMVLKDKHDLIHKAAGWMLREVGKRVSEEVLHEFLINHAAIMPRTMLRYAIEQLEPQQRQHYMQLKSRR